MEGEQMQINSGNSVTLKIESRFPRAASINHVADSDHNNQYTTAEEDAMINQAFQDLMQGYLDSKHRKKAELIERAFKFAKNAHHGIRRRSGEPYILHPIAVAKIASQEIGLGSTSICAALLHDVVEDTDYTVEDIEHHFGKKIAQLVDGLTKISGGIFGEQASAQAENFRKLLLTMSEDIRVILIKMADRLHNMRTLGSMAPAKQFKIAGETLYIYAPLAHRLGLFAIKTELEDLSFKYEHPAAYREIEQKIAETEKRRTEIYTDFATPIISKLKAQGLKFEAKARMKSVYSIWKKMETKQVPFEEVYDLYAMRIIFDCEDQSKEKQLCWSIYSTITDLYRLHPERTRDWVVTPKANGYQALHLTVMGPDGNWVEVQIRSRRMDEIAEKGFAAHWKYKIGESDEESELSAWLRTIQDILENPSPNAMDFLDTLKLNLFASEIVVFTPKGKLITLPKDSTVLDLAFELHSELGCQCIAGKVNHKLVPLSYKLQSGDQVEVLTSQTQSPKPEWVDLMVTAKGKTALRKALSREQQPLIAKGKELFESYLQVHGIELTNDILTKIQGKYKVANRDELFAGIGRDEIKLDESFDKVIHKAAKKSERGLISKILGINKPQQGQKVPEGQDVAGRSIIDPRKTYELVRDDSGCNYVVGNCCHPIPGDEVLGFIKNDRNVEIHHLDCERAMALKASYGKRIVATKWGTNNGTYPVKINIEGLDRHGILQELTAMISQHLGLDIRGLNIEANDEVFTARLNVRVANADTVTSLCNKIRKIDGIKTANRLK